MLHIAHVTGVIATKYGAQQRFMVALAEECSERGHKFFCFWDEPPAPTQVVTDVAAAGGQTVILPVRGKEILYLLRMILWLKSHKLDVVHVHFNPSALLALIAAWFARVPVRISSIRSGLLPHHVSKLPLKAYWVSRLRRQLSHKVFTVSEAVRCQYEHLGLGGPKLETRYTGIKSLSATKTREEMRRGFDIGPDQPVIVCVAFHNWMKGVDVLLKAMQLIKEKLPTVRLVEVGGSLIPQETEYLHSLAEELGLKQCVIWTGHRNDVRDILECADVYCQPSRVEGLGFSVLEAMDAGVAVVGTRVGGIPEALGNGQAGLLVDPDNPSALAQAILKLLKNPSLCREMGNNGKNLVANTFDLQKQTKLLVDEYEFLFQRQSKRALRL